MGKKKLIFIFIAIIAIIAIFLVSYFIFSIDADFKISDNLMIRLKEYPEAENSFYLLNKASNDVYWENEYEQYVKDIQINTSFDKVAASNFLLKNNTCLTDIDKILKIHSFCFPAQYFLSNEKSYSKNNIIFINWKRLAIVQFIKGLTSYNDKITNSIKESLKLLKLGHLIQNGNSKLAYYTIGSYYKNLSYQLLAWIIKNTPDIDMNLLDTISIELNKIPEDNSALIESLKAELLFNCSYTDFFRSANKNKLLFKPNQTKKMFAELTLFLISNLNNTWEKLSTYEENNEPQMSSTYSGSYLFMNKYGKDIYNQLRVPLSLIFSLENTEKFYRDSLNILIKLTIYKKVKGEFPKTLNELIPEYINSVPTDPFDGKPIRYSYKIGILYNIGFNLIDDTSEEKLLLKLGI